MSDSSYRLLAVAHEKLKLKNVKLNLLKIGIQLKITELENRGIVNKSELINDLVIEQSINKL